MIAPLSPSNENYVCFQALHPLDPSRLFGWQAANTLGSPGKRRMDQSTVVNLNVSCC